MNTATETLKNAISGLQGVIVVRTHETERVLDALSDIVRDVDGNLLVWSVSDGIRERLPTERLLDGEQVTEMGYREPVSLPKPVQNYNNPPGAIRAAMEFNEEKTGPLVVTAALNLHHWYKVPDVQQLILDASNKFLTDRRALVLIGSSQELPAEVAKVVTVIDWPLPTYDEICTQVSGYIEAVNKSCMMYEHIEHDGRIEVLARALQGLTQVEIKHTLNMLLTTFHTISTEAEALTLVIGRKAQAVKATRALEYIHTTEDMSKVGGLSALKEYIAEVAPVYSEEAQNFGAVPPRGCLLVGFPGTGKSLSAQCIAAQFNVPLIRLDAGSLFSSLVGSSEETIRSALKVAEAVAPCVLWIDEVEKGLGGGGGELDGGTSQRVFGTLLTWMEMKARQAEVFVVMTANDAQRIDPPLLQRVDTFFVGMPDVDARVEVLDIHIRKNGRDPDELGIDLVNLAEISEGYSPRELEDAVLSSVRKTYRRIKDGEHEGDVTTDIIREAIEEIVPLSESMAAELQSMKEWSKVAKNADKKTRNGSGRRGKVKKMSLVGGDLLPDAG